MSFTEQTAGGPVPQRPVSDVPPQRAPDRAAAPAARSGGPGAVPGPPPAGRPRRGRLSRTVHRVWADLRPLDPRRSIKAKLGFLVVASVLISTLMFVVAVNSGTQVRIIMIFSLLASLLLTQFLAHSMTAPIREMTAAARAMAEGDYSRRVRATSRDEVGDLAATFNKMAADLEASDRHRRELVANVSHELRTPIAALHAVLENVVDGVVKPEPETMVAALEQTDRLGRLVAHLLDLSKLDDGVVPLDRR